MRDAFEQNHSFLQLLQLAGGKVSVSRRCRRLCFPQGHPVEVVHKVVMQWLSLACRV